MKVGWGAGGGERVEEGYLFGKKRPEGLSWMKWGAWKESWQYEEDEKLVKEEVGEVWKRVGRKH